MPAKHLGKAAKWLDLLERLGPALQRPYSDMVAAPIRELRPKMGRLQHRFLYVIHGKRILITNGFLKQASAVPIEEIERARRRYEEWIREEGA